VGVYVGVFIHHTLAQTRVRARICISMQVYSLRRLIRWLFFSLVVVSYFGSLFGPQEEGQGHCLLTLWVLDASTHNKTGPLHILHRLDVPTHGEYLSDT